ncbi:MAG: ankyrin repeat domain-containing protein [Bacteroidales bacterium]|nr:ankyrin repeat domain-containing protein [Bacteroidales bacterium]
MTYTNIQKKLSLQLRAELMENQPDENKIRELVKLGADVNYIDNNDDNSMLMDAVCLYSNKKKSLKLAKLLLELGADINYEIEGWNALWEACLSKNIELVKFLLKNNANPNPVSVDEFESLLDFAQNEEDYCLCSAGSKSFDNYGSMAKQKLLFLKDANIMKEIILLLKKYGAKTYDDIFADKPENFIIISADFTTGLRTKKGNLYPDKIPGTNYYFNYRFKKWLNEYPKPINDISRISKSPDMDFITKFNNEGLYLSKRIKKLIDKDIKVTSRFIDLKLEEKNIRKFIDKIIL